MRKDTKTQRYKDTKKKVNLWWENKIERVRNLSKPYAARAARYGALAGVAILLLITVYSYFLPKDRFQQAKERVLRNPNDFEAHLILAEEFLKNNQLKEAEKELLAANNRQQTTNNKGKVLGLSSWLEELWSQWREENPEELKKMIAEWEKFVAENPTYRDGLLRLSLYSYKLGENEKAKDYLQKALDLDPNFEATKELQRILGD